MRGRAPPGTGDGRGERPGQIATCPYRLAEPVIGPATSGRTRWLATSRACGGGEDRLRLLTSTAPAISAATGEALDGYRKFRHAAGDRRRRRAHGAHAYPCHRRNQGRHACGAIEAAGSAVIGRDAGELAGLGANGIKVVSDAAPLLKSADGLIEFTIPAATPALAQHSAAAGIVHVIGTTGHSAEEEAVIAKAAQPRADRQIRQHELGRQSARRVGQARGADARRGLRHRDPGNASQQENRRAVGHGADVRPRGGGRPRRRSATSLGARPRRHDRRRAKPATSALPRCAAAPWSATIR